ncbi:MAG: hypothetical protein LBB38_02450, partial [Puniceicoccales bacterium]|nr:hypothetical protein [Puniceicoccales bacterium]
MDTSLGAYDLFEGARRMQNLMTDVGSKISSGAMTAGCAEITCLRDQLAAIANRFTANLNGMPSACAQTVKDDINSLLDILSHVQDVADPVGGGVYAAGRFFLYRGRRNGHLFTDDGSALTLCVMRDGKTFNGCVMIHPKNADRNTHRNAYEKEYVTMQSSTNHGKLITVRESAASWNSRRSCHEWESVGETFDEITGNESIFEWLAKAPGLDRTQLCEMREKLECAWIQSQVEHAADEIAKYATTWSNISDDDLSQLLRTCESAVKRGKSALSVCHEDAVAEKLRAGITKIENAFVHQDFISRRAQLLSSMKAGLVDVSKFSSIATIAKPAIPDQSCSERFTDEPGWQIYRYLYTDRSATIDGKLKSSHELVITGLADFCEKKLFRASQAMLAEREMELVRYL